jgi:phosphate transport system ATP-binding protein
MDEDTIRVEDLNIFDGDKNLLKDINLQIPRGKVVCVIGPSGCGKTIFLRCLNRFIDFNEGLTATGRIIIDGADILERSVDVISLRTKIGMISQKPYPLPMSIYDNVAYGPRLHGTRDKASLDRAVEDSLKQAALWEELRHRLREPAARLSIGQQQRLSIARTLAVKPKILVCDEPTSALDPVSSSKIEELILQLKKDYTILMSTHNIHQAKRLADYVIYLYLGSLIEHGPAKEIFHNPRHDRTRAYLKGEYYEDYTVDAEIDLREYGPPSNYLKAKEAMDGLKVEQVLRILVNTREALRDIPKGLETEGHKIIHRKQVSGSDWEIVTRKAE